MVRVTFAEQGNGPMVCLNASPSARPPAPGGEVYVVTNTDAASIDGGNVWSLRTSWDASNATTVRVVEAHDGGSIGFRTFSDPPDSNPRTYGVVVPSDSQSATPWTLVAASTIEDLTAFPVWMAQIVPPPPGGSGGTIFLTQNCSPSVQNMQATATPVDPRINPGYAMIWMARPFDSAVPPADFLNTTVEGVSVETMLVTIWNALVGTEWATTYAATVIAWAYEYPTSYPNHPAKWSSDVTTYLYNTVYQPYFVAGLPGFGTGNPPNGDPPLPGVR